MTETALELKVYGTVQGVGFRPYVWRLAKELKLKGWVRNEGSFVQIALFGPPAKLETFRQTLLKRPPPKAKIERVEDRPLQALPPKTFEIQESRPASVFHIPPDVALCEACWRELSAPHNRRFRYPFTHCAECGPRFSIIERLPYDRQNTSLKRFPLCPQCEAEYRNPENRRFHAEAIACSDCGPKVWTVPESGHPIEQTIRWLKAGKIVAVKGIGGFHLMVDATNRGAVRSLRWRKNRPTRPFALMARDLTVIRRYCRITPLEERALTSSEAPIVLLKALPENGLPEEIAPGTDKLGFMLPYSPLHALLLEAFDTPLVCTSANPSGAPLCAANGEALAQLAEMADAFLLHDRDIVHRCDDSVVQEMAGEIHTLRLGRGRAPLSLPRPQSDKRAVLALGGDLKSSIALLHRGHLLLSQHIAERLLDRRAFEHFKRSVERFCDLLDVEPSIIAVDRHPDYISTRFGHRLAESLGARLVEVQHHHAHFAAALAEHDRLEGPALGVILDGLGYAADGTFWGGELLFGDARQARRLARLKPAPLFGGEKAALEPWRNLAARLWQAGIPFEDFRPLKAKPEALIEKLLVRGLHAPLASSTGRLFDAVAAALDLLDRQHYEGEAAMRLEALSHRSDEKGGYAFKLSERELDPAPLWSQIRADLRRGVPKSAIARRFHLGLAEAWRQLVTFWGKRLGCRKVVLAGGVFQNRLLLETLRKLLEVEGFEVLSPKQIPPSDGGLSLGQAVVAAAQLEES